MLLIVMCMIKMPIADAEACACQGTGKAHLNSQHAASHAYRSKYFCKLAFMHVFIPLPPPCSPAGSERSSKDSVAGSSDAAERQRETNSINRSLTCLGLVILRLTERREGGGLPVPYRDSKLTHLLQVRADMSGPLMSCHASVDCQVCCMSSVG